MERKKIYAYAAVLFSMVFWSLSFIWYKEAYEAGFRPITIIFLRLTFSFTLLCIAGIPLGWFKWISPKDIPRFILISAFQPLLYFLFETFGMQYVSSTFGALIISTIPLFTPFAALIFNKERLSFMNLAGVIISFSGVLVVMITSGSFETSVTGTLLLMGAVISAVGYSVCLKPMASKYNPVTIITYQNFLGIVFLAPLFLATEISSIGELKMDFTSFLPLIKLSIFASTLAFLFFTYGLSKIGVARTSIFSNIIPVFTAIFAYFILNEAITLQKILGTFIVIGGLFLSQIPQKSKSKASGQS